MTNRTEAKEVNRNLIIAAKKLISTYPHLYKDLVEKPALNDFAEIPNVVSFIEKEKDLDATNWGPWYFQLHGREKSDFIYLLIATIVILYDPEYFKTEKSLRHNLRSELVKYLGIGGSSVSDRLNRVKDTMSVYPFFSKDVYQLASKYKSIYL